MNNSQSPSSPTSQSNASFVPYVSANSNENSAEDLIGRFIDTKAVKDAINEESEIIEEKKEEILSAPIFTFNSGKVNDGILVSAANRRNSLAAKEVQRRRRDSFATSNQANPEVSVKSARNSVSHAGHKSAGRFSSS